LLLGRPRNDCLGGRAGLCLGQPWFFGAARLGGFRLPIRHPRRALVLDRRHSRHGVSGHRDDAFLLYFKNTFRPRLSTTALRFGALRVPILGLIETGGWKGMVARIQQNFPGQDYTHAWSTLGRFQDNPMGMHWTGIVFGLGAVQAMGYWTTDFLVVQRVLSAK